MEVTHRAVGTGVVCETWALQAAVIPAKAGRQTFGNALSTDWIRFRGNDWRFERDPIPNDTTTARRVAVGSKTRGAEVPSSASPRRFTWKAGLLFSNIGGVIAGGTAMVLEARALAELLCRR